MDEQIRLQPILQLKNIHKSFAGVHALQGVDFEVLPGEIHALVGENGAGKSTLVKVITGVHQPDQGEIRLNGELLELSNTLVAQRHGIAAIYQEATLFPDLDIAENIYMGHQPIHNISRAIRWPQLYEQATKPLRSLGVNLDPHTRVRGLTIAQMQMVEMAKALSFNAKVLIMDEPTSVLTQREVEDLFRITRQLKDGGTAIIFITHRLDEVFNIADRVTVLRDGHYVATKDIKEVTHDELIRLMVGRTLDALFPKKVVERGKVLLKVDNLSKEGIFEKISFELHQGEILGLAGLVGARRTDVAKAIFGIEPADAGSIIIDGQSKTVRSARQAMDLGIAYVPEDRQHFGLVLPLNITHNVTMPILQEFARMGWVDKTHETQTALDYATQLEVKAAGLWQKACELSGGNQQKVVLAKWLASRPRILILDEPTRGIDVGTKAAVHELMSTLASQGLAILMISSELPEILGMSDRVLVMCEGRMTGEFSRAEATQEGIMLAATARSRQESPQPVLQQ
jgi:rhamnose transport system ATP-binding protein